jgi:hypothetical protein
MFAEMKKGKALREIPKKKLSVIVVAAALLAGLQCSQPSEPGSNLSDQYSIYLAGRVLNSIGNPVANAVAKLAGRNLSDTTDENGWYRITEKKTAGLQKVASVGDSVEILKDGQFITYLGVPAWIDTLPDVRLVQRNIGGDFLSAPVSFSRVTAVLTVGADTVPKVKDLWYNTANQSYSGFIYFVYTTQSMNYSVYVNVYNADSALIGRSVAVNFPSSAGDIDVPAFDPSNAMPSVYAGDDTIVSINDTVRLHATASDGFGGSIAKWEWSINGGSFNQTSSGDMVIVAPVNENQNYSCVVRVTDNDSITVTDEMIVTVVLDPPVANAGNDMAVAKNSQVTLHGSVSQEFGTVVKWEWNIGNSGFVQTSTCDTMITTLGSVIEAYPCILKVTDDDGNVAEDTVYLQVGIPAPTLVSPADGDTVRDIINEHLVATTLAWDSVAGSACYYYNLQISIASDFSSAGVVFDDTRAGWVSEYLSLDRGTTYYWRVRAIIKATDSTIVIDSSEWSSAWSFATEVRPGPTQISPRNYDTVYSLPPMLKWNLYSGATLYHLQVGLDTSSLIVNDSTLTTDSMAISSPLTDRTYYVWRVRSMNWGSGWSDWSTSWWFMVIP